MTWVLQILKEMKDGYAKMVDKFEFETKEECREYFDREYKSKKRYHCWINELQS